MKLIHVIILALCSCLLLGSGCIQFAAKSDQKLQDEAVTLYQNTQTFFESFFSLDRAARDKFYVDTFGTLKVMELQAQVDTEATPRDPSVINIVNDLERNYADLRKSDMQGQIKNQKGLEFLEKPITSTFYSLLVREQSGSVPTGGPPGS
ncbi:MAG: hypothetical protein JO170_10130 [Verrucomicrobia bacterium]|nr:hypothetical protein [Verrucomicrobiota bacterium]